MEKHQAEIKRLTAFLREFSAPNAIDPLFAIVEHEPLPAEFQSSYPRTNVKGVPFLEAIRRTLDSGVSYTAKEIADKLLAAGYESEAADKYATIYNQLDQYAKKGVGIIKMGDRSSGVLWRRR